MKFTHLHVHSHYSLLDGLPKIDDLIEGTKNLGMDAIALTDHGNLYGALEFYQKAKKAGIKPIIGCEMYIAYEKLTDKRPNIDNKRYHLTVLARNYEGYKNLMRLVTIAHCEGYYYKPRIDKQTLQKYSSGLLALSGCMSSEISKAILEGQPLSAERLIREYQDIFGKEYFFLELGAHANMPEQKIINDALFELSKKTGAQVVATSDIHYIHREDTEAQDILVSIQTGVPVNDPNRMTMKHEDFSMKTGEEILGMFPDHPEAIENTNSIASLVDIEIPLGKILLPTFVLPKDETNLDDYLTKLCHQGLESRFGKAYENTSEEARVRLDYELSVIKKMGFSSYFLIVRDFVHWAKSHDIVVGPGRGSAAGSLVSYLLNITNIDPLKYNLIFERFLNPSRVSMPDIDLDFADTGRDEVLRYAAEKYGYDNLAQIITFGTMAARAAIRDTGRALGYSYGFCDTLAKFIPFNPTQGMKIGWLKESMETVPELKSAYENSPDVKRLINLALKLEGVARHASTHACGVVIGPEPLYNYLPLQHPPRLNEKEAKSAGQQILVTQYEMHSVEDLGLLKMDFLGLKNLSIIENTLKRIHSAYGMRIDIDTIPLDDMATYRLFQDAKTTGVFQMESSGMRRYLKELQPTELEDIIAMVALYRPGPMDLIPSYIKRKHGEEKIEYLHQQLEPILKNTYGIGVYQEQMMRIAQNLAGFTLAQADTLRKAIGKKIKKLLNEQRGQLISGMIQNGIDAKTAGAIWDLFPPFARYGFNRSHAACYALVAYQTAYLKTHYPAEFMSSLMTAELADIERIGLLVQETKEMGIEILPPDINESFETFTVVPNTQKPKIRFGLSAVKNVGENIVAIIIEERKNGGKFTDCGNFIERIGHKDLNKKSIEALIKCGALDLFADRATLLHNIDIILEYAREHKKQKSQGQSSLFGAVQNAGGSIALTPAPAIDKKEILRWEKEHLGLFVSEHPILEYLHRFPHSVSTLASLMTNSNGKNVTVGCLIGTAKKILTKKGEPMLFVQMEDMTGRAEALVFPRVLKETEIVWREGTIAIIKGTVSDKDGSLKILCDDATKIA
ncbi:MAG: DNA polymerase III subunit alpha [Patescibacteria group bacterium]